MGGFVYAAVLTVLLLTGSFAVALAAGLAAIHWMNGRRPCLDAAGWFLATYGAAACAIYDVLASEAGAFTAGWVVVAVVSGYVTGTRTCGQSVVVPVHLGGPEEDQL